MMKARRLRITRKQASRDIRVIAASLYRAAGLLQPASAGDPQAAP